MTEDEHVGGAGSTAPPPVSLYVHVPFCVSKCAYCDFYSVAADQVSDPRVAGRFVDAVLRELDRPGISALLRDVPTLYFGGGTPTLLGDGLVDLLVGVRERVGLRPDAEVTVETNPETTDPELVAHLVSLGVNRFSVGVQSFDDRVLRTLGRCHNAGRAAAACSAIVRSGADSSIDLMCGVPGQTMDSWRETLERAAMTGATHASVYPLTVEDGTPLAATIAEGAVSAVDPDVAAEMMIVASEVLGRYGIERYEVANYATPGHESKHNLGYWTGRAYLGLGPAAASMLPLGVYRVSGLAVADGAVPVEASGGRVRFTLGRDLAAFVRDGLHAASEAEYLSPPEVAREDVMLGLRLVRGVAREQVEAAGAGAALERLAADGLVELADGAWRTTERGWLLGNEVFGAVWDSE